MNKELLVSVVVLNYNGIKYLKKTVKPILDLNYSNFEFIIVDNGSTDGSLEFIKSFKDIKLIEVGSNLGYSKGKNIGMKYAKGKYVLLLDNDILITNLNLINELICFQNKHKNCIISVPLKNLSQSKIDYLGGYYSRFYFCRDHFKEIFKFQKPHLVGYPNGGAFFIQLEIWNNLGGFDESQPFNIDDKDIGIRAYLYGYGVIINSNIVLKHIGYVHRDNLYSWSWKYQYYFSGYLRIIIKNCNWKNILITSIGFTFYTVIKTLKHSITKKSLLPIKAFSKSIFIFVSNLSDTLNQRRIIQSRRIIKEDIFFNIKPPK